MNINPIQLYLSAGKPLDSLTFSLTKSSTDAQLYNFLKNVDLLDDFNVNARKADIFQFVFNNRA